MRESPAFEFAEPGAVFHPAHLGEFVDDQDAIEVVRLVLETPREQSRSVDLEGLAFQIEGLHAYDIWTDDIASDARQAQAALFEGRAGVTEFCELWIDADDRAIGPGLSAVGGIFRVLGRRDIADEDAGKSWR